MGLAVDDDDNLLIADAGNYRIRRVTPAASGVGFVINTVAGGGLLDGNVLALNAALGPVHGLSVGNGGDIYLTDTYYCRIRRFRVGGQIVTIAGRPAATGGCESSLDGAAATSRPLFYP